ncbi:flavin-containing monooxygenase [Nocardia vinacea]|uniref:flavin-containing monooxygenase n=1 Tax=Nocardia vinacea TaxID=96468 RepID=UPI0003037BFE|nr:NAD(P)/FAD-dependent oxidoreductase [Nocardia vinacea]
MATKRRGDRETWDEMIRYVDVLIVGAGISGIGAGSHLKSKLPDKTFLIVDARESIGGTWDLFRYPGIRADTDAQTFSYEFKPWRRDNAIADGAEILSYLHETVAEYTLSSHLRLGWKVASADWSSQRGLWAVQLSNVGTGRTATVECRWLFGATGYYDYDQGYRPHFDDEERFTGEIVHPQHWPQDLDYRGRKVVVIGSGATAITLVPAMAETAAHVTLLQRSPTYILPIPSRDPVTDGLRKLLPEHIAYRMSRTINRTRLAVIYAVSRRYPRFTRRLVRWVNKKALPKGYPVDQHFKPSYDPWHERMCFARDGDLFSAISTGKASVVTDRIARFTERGIELATGDSLDADIVVTATGLQMIPLRAMTLSLDGVPIDVADAVVYKGMMLSGVPNFAFAFGYTNAAWTLKVDLVCEHLCRLIAHLDNHGEHVAVPVANDPTLRLTPMVDFHAGYVRRAAETLPRQGSHGPWSMAMSYRADRDRLVRGPVADPALRTSRISTDSDVAVRVG